MGLYVSTTGTSVSVPELGITLAHPTTDFDVGAQFSPDEARGAGSLTTAIRAGTLVWKKTAGGSTEAPTDYDGDWLENEAENTGPGQLLDQVALIRDFSDLVKMLDPSGLTWIETPTYLGNGEIDFIEYTKAGVRRARVDFTYNASLNPLTETWRLYASDGTTVQRTVTKTVSYTGIDPTGVTAVYS